jgi:hypothetical protein
VPAQTRHRDPVDAGGGLLLTAGSVALLYGIIDGPERGWGSWLVLGSLLLALVLLALFVWYELRAEHPMLDPRLFRLAGVRAGSLGIVALFFALFGLFYSLPPSHAGVSSGLNSTTREFGSALGVAVFSTILTARFASHLPATLARVPGAQGQAIRHSITSALHYAAATPDPAVRAHLVSGTRDAFTSGTSLGLRVGAVLLLITTAVVAHQHPRDQEA